MIRSAMTPWVRNARFQGFWEKLHGASLVGMNY